ncbi:hypothetical protein NQZ68_033864 [Dissostichus eleginoides]|nr:hypothetical protein NQZ68_033864 [Dissostichus eleginoides]
MEDVAIRLTQDPVPVLPAPSPASPSAHPAALSPDYNAFSGELRKAFDHPVRAVPHFVPRPPPQPASVRFPFSPAPQPTPHQGEPMQIVFARASLSPAAATSVD